MLPRKYRIHTFLVILSLVIIFYPLYHKQPDQQRIDASSAAVVEFFELVDQGKYEQSWHAAARYLRNDMPLEQWVERLQTVRSRAGQVVERQQEDVFATQGGNKGIPEGEYMVYSFETRFSDRDMLKETVTVMLEDDQSWRVAGYFIE